METERVFSNDKKKKPTKVFYIPIKNSFFKLKREKN